MDYKPFHQRLKATLPSVDASTSVVAEPTATVRGWILTTCDSNEFEDIPEGERILIADTPEYANGTRAVVLYPDGIMIGMNVYLDSDAEPTFLKSSSFSPEGVDKLTSVLTSAKCKRSAFSLTYPTIAWLFGAPVPR